MADQETITIAILAHNEAENLKELLPTLGFAGRVIVVDDESEDSTQEVCKQCHVDWVKHRLTDFADQRNFALSLVKSGWVLFVDADERLDEKLIYEVRNKKYEEGFGYQLKRVDYWGGKELKHGETGKVWITRLGKVGSGSWVGKVHEVWQIPTVKRLSGVLKHNSHDSTRQLFEVVARYAQVRAAELYKEKKYWSIWEQIAYPITKFFNNYFIKLGFMDGFPGLMMALAMSYHSFLVRWLLLKKSRLAEYTNDTPLFAVTVWTIVEMANYAFDSS